ncbi:helix-turn-helix domain-containing protein [Vibrio nigripulchritudo]|uniref:helix-turn-helix domain-containing protein n=1 Tax=Vibrio nigripulchritudo TaxID=28173 RepID=UPI002490D347|nr:XRE family transcriptional regulator [Vibrio nigripulchritudo]BDU46891.1 hypothetical protein TUMSATVNIG3_56890 [Vibrio nigripulchritudo]
MSTKHPITAALILNARKASGLEQAEFIQTNGIKVSQGTFSRWETGVSQVPLNVLLDLKLVTPVSIESLYQGGE